MPILEEKNIKKNKGLLTEIEAAAFIGVSESALGKARREGARPGHLTAPPHIRAGRSIRYCESDLLDWVQKHRCTPTPASE